MNMVLITAAMLVTLSSQPNLQECPVIPPSGQIVFCAVTQGTVIAPPGEGVEHYPYIAINGTPWIAPQTQWKYLLAQLLLLK